MIPPLLGPLPREESGVREKKTAPATSPEQNVEKAKTAVAEGANQLVATAGTMGDQFMKSVQNPQSFMVPAINGISRARVPAMGKFARVGG